MLAQRILWRAHTLVLAVVGVYALILALLSVPWLQREFTFLQRIKYPLFADFENPEAYGLAPFKTRNLYLETPDGETIGAWHVLPQSYYASQIPFPPRQALDLKHFDLAFGKRPTVLYFHGNAATRAQGQRVRGYIELSTRLDCNVVAIDYRGFAESTGQSTETGLVTDARTVWDWVYTKIQASGVKNPEKNMILVGHSLGTGVSSALAGRLAAEGIRPRAIALLAPFTTVPDLLASYWLFGFIPLLSPLKAFPTVQRYFQSHMSVSFNSTANLSSTSSPTLLVHAVGDGIIPHTHSKLLYESLVTPNGTTATADIHELDYEGWGRVSWTEREGRPLIWFEGHHGGHNRVSWHEGTLDLIAWVADL